MKVFGILVLLTFVTLSPAHAGKSNFISLAKVIDGVVWRTFDINSDGNLDYATRPLDKGYETIWKEGKDVYRLEVKRPPTGNERLLKTTYRKKGERDWIVIEKEEHSIRKDGNLAILRQKWLTDNQRVTTVSVHSPSYDMFERDWINDQYDSLHRISSYGQCQRSDVIRMGFAAQRLVGQLMEGESIDQNEATIRLLDDTLGNVVLTDCGDDFEQDIVAPALEQGLECLNGLGGAGPRYAGEILGLLQHNSGMNPVTVNCSNEAIGRDLVETDGGNFPDGTTTEQAIEMIQNRTPGTNGDPVRPSATGMAASTCDHDSSTHPWPSLTLWPGNGVGGGLTQDNDEARMQYQRATFFHELFHNLGFYHNSGTVDMTYMCTFACFADSSYQNGASANAFGYSSQSFNQTKTRARALCANSESVSRSAEAGYRSRVNRIGTGFEEFSNGETLYDVLRYSTGVTEILFNNRAFLYPDPALAGRIGNQILSGDEDVITPSSLVYAAVLGSETIGATESNRIINVLDEVYWPEHPDAENIESRLRSARLAITRMPMTTLEVREDGEEDGDIRDLSADAQRLKNAWVALKNASRRSGIPSGQRETLETLSDQLKQTWRAYCRRFNYQDHNYYLMIGAGPDWIWPIRDEEACTANGDQ